MDNNIFLSSSELSCNVIVNMNNNIITNLPTPVNPNDGANKSYADTTISTNLTAPFIKITAIPGLTATNLQDAISELYTDTQYVLLLSGGTMTGNIDMNKNTITTLATPTDTETSYAANVAYVSTYVQNNMNSVIKPEISNIASQSSKVSELLSMISSEYSLYLAKTGGAMTGDLQMNSHTITGMKTPTDTETDYAADVAYVNTYITNAVTNLSGESQTNAADITKLIADLGTLTNETSLYLSEHGGAMTGNLQMNNHALTGLSTPSSSSTTDAVNVQYINNLMGGLHYPAFYLSLQYTGPTITISDSPWQSTSVNNNRVFFSYDNSSYYSFDATYTKWYLVSKGLYFFQFSIMAVSSSETGQISVYLNDGVASTSTEIATCYFSSVGGNVAAVIPISTTPQTNQYYLTYKSDISTSPQTNTSIMCLAIGG